MAADPQLLSAPEVADYLGIELDTLYRYARSGRIRGLKIGNLWRFSAEDLREFVDSRRTGGEPRHAPASPRLLTDLLRAPEPGGSDTGGVSVGTVFSSIKELDVLSDRFAATLVEVGIRPGDRVLLLVRNSVEFVVACLAVWKVRAILVADDPTIRTATLEHILSDSKPRVLILDRSVAEQIEAQRPLLGEVAAIFVKDRTFALSGLDGLRVESLDEVLEREAAFQSRFGPAEADEVVTITYTSGSTGVPKGVMNTHASWLAGAEYTRDNAGITSRDKILIPLPLYHGLAFRQVLAYLLARGTVLVAADIYQALNRLRKERPSALVLVPAACNIVLDHFASVLPEVAATLRYMEIGSAGMPPDRFTQLKGLLPSTTIHLPYGLTEARVGFLTRGETGLMNKLISTSPGLRVSVQEPDGGPTPRGETGEIVLEGRGLMKGYWKGSATDGPLTGGFRTGDMARVATDGSFEILGRADQMLKIRGKKVNPIEVETVLSRHPGVAECAVVGLRDPRGLLELELNAFVVASRGANVTEDDLSEWCRKHLETYKLPARIHLRSSLPKSPVGKILRPALAAEYAPRNPLIEKEAS